MNNVKSYKLMFILSFIFILFTTNVHAVLYMTSNEQLYQYSPLYNTTTLIYSFPYNITQFDVSDNDSKIIVFTGSTESFNSTDVYVSSDYGLSFTHYDILPEAIVQGISISPDGNYLYSSIKISVNGSLTCSFGNCRVYLYTYNFNSFGTPLYNGTLILTQSNLASALTDIKTSTDGQYIIVSLNGIGFVFNSLNYGQSYVQTHYGYSPVTCISPTGQYQYASFSTTSPNGQGVHNSSNYGLNWTLLGGGSNVGTVNVPQYCDDSGRFNTYWLWPASNFWFQNETGSYTSGSVIGYSGNYSYGYGFTKQTGITTNSSRISITYNRSFTGIELYDLPFTVSSNYLFTTSESINIQNRYPLDNNSLWNVSIDMSNVILNNAGVYDVYLTGIPLTATATYYIQSNVSPFYLSTVCSVESTSAESQIVVDLFEYTNLTENGWIGVCPDFTTAVIKTNLNRSLYINSTSCSATMSKIIPSYALGNNLNINYDTFPIGETNYTVGIKSNTYQDMIKLQYVYDGTTMCIYSNTTQPINLIHCINMNSNARDELVNSIVMNLGTEQSFNLDTYVFNSLGTMISEQHSSSVPLINSNLQAGYVSIQSYNSVSDFFFDFLVVESITRVLPFTLVTSPYVQECDYTNVSKFYQTNFYYQSTNVTGYNNVKSFIVTGKSITKSEAQLNMITPSTPVGNVTTTFDNREQSFINSLFGTNLTTSQKLFYAIMVLFVAGLMIIIFASSFGMDAVLTGVLTVTIELTLLIFFAFIGFIPVWIIIIVAIIAAGIVAMFMKKALTQ